MSSAVSKLCLQQNGTDISDRLFTAAPSVGDHTSVNIDQVPIKHHQIGELNNRGSVGAVIQHLQQFPLTLLLC